MYKVTRNFTQCQIHLLTNAKLTAKSGQNYELRAVETAQGP